MLRTLIVDDEPIIRADIETLLAACPDVSVVGACGSVREAILLIETLKPDLLLLDIQLTDGISFEIIEALPGLRCAVIFITAYDKHAIRAIRIGALDYLLKPVDEEELHAALDKVRQRLGADLALQTREARKHLTGKSAAGGAETQSIVLRSQKEVQVVPYADIIFCEGEGNYTTFHLAGARKLLVSKPLKEYDDLLPGAQFVRTHQSYLVNLRYIDRYDREGLLLLTDGSRVPVAVRKREQVRSLLTGGAAS